MKTSQIPTEEEEYVLISSTGTSVGASSIVETTTKLSGKKVESALTIPLNFEETVMKNLQDVPFNARSKPPEDFFMKYTGQDVVFPMLLVYLLVLLCVNVGSAIIKGH